MRLSLDGQHLHARLIILMFTLRTLKGRPHTWCDQYRHDVLYAKLRLSMSRNDNVYTAKVKSPILSGLLEILAWPGSRTVAHWSLLHCSLLESVDADAESAGGYFPLSRFGFVRYYLCVCIISSTANMSAAVRLLGEETSDSAKALSLGLVGGGSVANRCGCNDFGLGCIREHAASGHAADRRGAVWWGRGGLPCLDIQ